MTGEFIYKYVFVIVCILMDRQSILQKYEYKVESETRLQHDKDEWADDTTEIIAEFDQKRKKILERFFSKLKRHEQLLDLIKDGCEKAKNNSDSQNFEIVVHYYESAFNIEKNRFAQVLEYELSNVSLFYDDFCIFCTDSNWGVLGNSAGCKSRDKQLQLFKKMLTFFHQWGKMFSQHVFYDGGAHQSYVFYPDGDM